MFQHVSKKDKYIVERMMKNIRFQSFKKNDIVFNWGESGSLYFMIMKGSVSVMTPIETEHSFSLRELFYFV